MAAFTSTTSGPQSAEQRAWVELIDLISQAKKLPVATRKNFLTYQVVPAICKLHQFIISNPEILAEFHNLTESIKQYLNGDINFITLNILNHFGIKPVSDEPSPTLEIYPKKDGVQKGVKLVKTIPETDDEKGSQETYYIKTHQLGSTINSNSNKRVDPEELFLYKMLEHLQLGAKTQFITCPLSEANVLIATRDIAESSQAMQFETCTKLKEGPNAAVLGSEAVLKQIAELEVIRKIFTLDDLFSNTDNYGFVSLEDHSLQLRLFDFRFHGLDNLSVERLSKLEENPASPQLAALAPEQRNELELNAIRSVSESFLPRFKQAMYDNFIFLKQNHMKIGYPDLNVFWGVLGSQDFANPEALFTAFVQAKDQGADLGQLGRNIAGFYNNFQVLKQYYRVSENVADRNLEPNPHQVEPVSRVSLRASGAGLSGAPSPSSASLSSARLVTAASVMPRAPAAAVPNSSLTSATQQGAEADKSQRGNCFTTCYGDRGKDKPDPKDDQDPGASSSNCILM